MASENSDEFKHAFQSLLSDVASTIQMENSLSGKGSLKLPKPRGLDKRFKEFNQFTLIPRAPSEIVKSVLEECNKKRKLMGSNRVVDTSNEGLSKMAMFTDKFNLKPYEPFLHYVPRLVNVVTLAEAIPVEGSGTTLPLDLHRIAARCRNSYFAPKRFSAVQLAYSEPRCRVLVFHTGRMVGTGCCGPMAARLALLRAQRQLYTDAGVHIHLKNFNVINQVGAASLNATLNCEEFATAHSSTAHFDVKSFVGLAWRPVGEPICCEIYSTGRANLPGSIVERQLHESFMRMLPELLRYSSASRILSSIPNHVQSVHRTYPTNASTSECEPASLNVCAQKDKLQSSSLLWDGWGDADELRHKTEHHYDSSDEDDLDLSNMGL